MNGFLDIVATSQGFFGLISFFGIGAIGALLMRSHDQRANIWSNIFAIIGSAWGLLFSASILASHETISAHQTIAGLPLLSPAIRVDNLSAFFIFVISLISLFCSIYAIGYVKSYFKKYNIGNLGFFYNLFIVSMILVVSSSNSIWFLAVWEIMSLVSYFLVVYERNILKNIKAGQLYLIMTHIGTAFITLAFILLYKYTNSFDFTEIHNSMYLVPDAVKGVIFLLFFIGFGTKAGVIPMHIWLPSAHPAAPSHVSALMSGVMIKTGIYMMLRVFIEIFPSTPTWWGIVILIAGAISCVLGVLYALTEHDLKRLLAYHSIENVGIILLGVGSAMIFSSLNEPGFATLSLTAALFHTINHAIFKSLLFLGAGSVVHATNTRNIEKFGGLIKLMPYTALFFLVGSMAISALPPLNGFFSEWLTFLALFHGITYDKLYIQVSFWVATGALALTGGLALACFVKAFGGTFLARPRSSAAKNARESSAWMIFGMGGVALLCVIFGLGSGYVSSRLQIIAHSILSTDITSFALSIPDGQTMSVSNGFASVSGPVIFIAVAGVTLAAWILIRYGVNRNQKVTEDITWDCGTDLTERMEITSTGFARSTIMIFKGVLKPSLQRGEDYRDAASRYTPKSHSVSLNFSDIYQSYIYGPVENAFVAVSNQIKKIQNGNINAYIFYIFAVLIITVVVGL